MIGCLRKTGLRPGLFFGWDPGHGLGGGWKRLGLIGTELRCGGWDFWWVRLP